MFCKNCGKLIDEDSKFCSLCGTSTSVDVNHNDVSPNLTLNAENENRVKDDFIEISREQTSLGIVSRFRFEGNANKYLIRILKDKATKRLYGGYFLLTLGALIAIHQWNFVVDIFSTPDGIFDGGVTSLEVIFGLFLLLWGGYLCLRWKVNPGDTKHYIYKIIKKAGYQDIEGLSVDYVKSRENGTIKIKSYKLTTKFFFKEHQFSIEIYPLSQLYWIYQRVTQHSVNFIPTHKTYAAILHFYPKKKIEIEGEKWETPLYLSILSSFCPWAKLGYDK